MRLRTAPVLIGLLVSACGLDDAYRFQQDRCTTTDDCGDGRTCQEMLCVDIAARRLAELSVELTPPPNGSGLARTQIRRLSLPDGEGVLDFVLPEAAVFERTQVIDESRQEPIAASITVSGEDRIPGREVEARLSVSNLQSSPLSILPGTYTVRVLPLEGQRPGLEVKNWIIRRAGPSSVKEFVLGPPTRRLFGQVSFRTMLSQKLPGVRVRAVSEPSGLASTEALTDSEGRYDIELPDTEDTAFRLTASFAESNSPMWSFRQVVNVPRDEARNVDIGLEQTGELVVGLLGLSVFGVGPEGLAPEPIVGASVTLTATTSLPTRSFWVRGVTDESGRVVSESGGEPLPILAARYRVEVEPPPDGMYARTSTVLDLSQTGPTIQADRQLALSPRAEVLGRVTSSLGQNLARAAISIDDLDRVIRPVQATTQEDGTFRVHLDPGRYLVRIEGGQTAQNTDAHPVAFARLDVAEDTPRVDFLHSLPAGRLVRGQVHLHDGKTAPADVEVELFLEIEARSVSLGRTRTERNGAYSLVVSGAELEAR